MKKKNLFTMLAVTAALTFGFASCSNDDEVNVPDGVKATLSINLDAPTMSRAVGDVPADAVSDYTVFITNSSTGEIGWSKYSADAQPLTNISVTTQADHVYVVANAGDLTKTITTLADLKAFKADLDGVGKQTAKRWATGKTATALTFDDNKKATATVTLKYIAARITVKVTNSMTNKEAENAVKINSLAVLNARGESLLFPAGSGESLVPGSYTNGKAFYTGYNMPAGANWECWPTSTTLAADLLADNSLVADGETNYYYYVFENAANATTDFPTIVTIVGKTGDGKDIYWPVHLASYEQFKAGSLTAGVTRGNSYDISINLTGDATSGGGGGTTDPSNPIAIGAVDVSIIVSAWNPIVLNKEF